METNSMISSVYWLGGSTCAGKTTVSNMLSEKYGLKVYHCDEYLGKHIEKSNAREHPNLNRVTKLGWNDILDMPVKDYLNWAIGLFREEYGMILDDLKEICHGQPILVEGAGLLPEFFNHTDVELHQAIWLVAEEGFYRKHQPERKEMLARAKECSDPELALKNYMSFDLAMGKYLLQSAKWLGWNVIETGIGSDMEKNADAVSSHFQLSDVVRKGRRE